MRAQSSIFIYRDWKFKPTCARSLCARAIPNRYWSRLEIRANSCELLVCAHIRQALFNVIKNSSQLVRDLCMHARPPNVIFRDWKFKPTLVCAHNPQPSCIGIRKSSQLVRDLGIRAQSPTATYRDWKFMPTFARSFYARTIPQPLFIALGSSSQLMRRPCLRAPRATVFIGIGNSS